ncbi:MAG: aldolase/citrate lyase family protein [Hydrogenophilus sp.]|nr:aldolase/citrate lyase family protein [Hydrogenophilus sp.]
MESFSLSAENSSSSLPPVVHYCGLPRYMHKALALQRERGPLFDVALDLEDGAPLGQEAEQARLVCALIADPILNPHRRVGVRIHSCTHPAWWSDLTTLLPTLCETLAFLTLPKVRRYDDVARLADLIARRCAAAHRTPPLHILIETHGALRDAFAIAAHPLVESLDFGLMDFISDHAGAIPAAAMRSPLQFEHPLIRRAKETIAAAAHAAGKTPTHNVCTLLDDPAAAHADAIQARQFGFTRMWSIHPSQIDPILAAFTPAPEEIDLAVRILTAAHAANWGPVRVDGQLHDRASYRYYSHLLQRARQFTPSLLPTPLPPLPP